MQHKKKLQNLQKKHIILVVTLLLLGTLIVLEKSGVTNFYTTKKSPTTGSSQPVDSINYGPPTKQEKNSGNEQKTKLTDQDPGQKVVKPSTAEVVIVDASQYDNNVEVRAFVANLLEAGTCTFTFRIGNNIVEKSQAAIPDASTTPCTNLSIPREEFTQAGTWNLTVTFESKSVRGSKDQKVVLQ